MYNACHKRNGTRIVYFNMLILCGYIIFHKLFVIRPSPSKDKYIYCTHSPLAVLLSWFDVAIWEVICQIDNAHFRQISVWIEYVNYGPALRDITLLCG